MKAAHGRVFKYGDNVDTDVIIPARYLNSSDPKELATVLAERTRSEVVQVIGKKIVLYKPAKENSKITLPK